jgi:carbamoyl-phosphate synthase small subunit
MSDRSKPKGKLIFPDGTRFDGFLASSHGLPVCGEMVFNTSMTGYQEVLTDPSYAGQIITMTYPQIGNYGVDPADCESDGCAAEALVVRELSESFSPAPGRRSLRSFLEEQELTCLEGVDTRAVTRKIRSEGAVYAVIGPAGARDEDLVAIARRAASNPRRNLVAGVSGGDRLRKGEGAKAAVVDLGVKEGILRSLARLGVDLTVLGHDFAPEEIAGGDFDFLVLSNGPGDPRDVEGVIDRISGFVGKIPMLGICLGHQLTALALGADTYKMKFGHRGSNQPVIDRKTGRVFITSQNHGYAVKADIGEIPGVEVTFVNANDGTVEGFSARSLGIHCVQFHPEASPGPHDTSFVFERFVEVCGRWHADRKTTSSRQGGEKRE